MNAPVRHLDLDDLDELDAARHVLLGAVAAGKLWDEHHIVFESGLPPEVEVAAIHDLDRAGAITAVLDASVPKARRWRVREITAAGIEVARLIRDERIWSRLRDDLIPRGDPFELMVRGYRDNFTVVSAG